MLQALLRSVNPVDVEGNTVVLAAASRFHRENIEKNNYRRIVEDVLSKLLGAPYTIRCISEERSEKKTEKDLHQQIRSVRKDPFVRAAINIFDAEVVDIETSEEQEEEE